MKILVIEPNASGHHMALYVRHVGRKIIEKGSELFLLTTQSAIAHRSYNLVKNEFEDKCRVYLMPELCRSKNDTSLALLYAQIQSWVLLRSAVGKLIGIIKPDVIYVPTLDWIVKAMELLGSPFGSIPFVGLYMSPKHHIKEMSLGEPSRHDWLYEKLFLKLLRVPTLHRLLVIDEYLLEYTIRKYKHLPDKISYVPDFGDICGHESKDACRKKLGIGLQDTVVLVYGTLTIRKGIKQLLDVFAKIAKDTNIVLIFAGRADEDVEKLIRSEHIKEIIDSGRIINRLYFHDDDEEYLVFRAADFTWLGYVSNFSASSGVMHKSVRAGLPILAMESGLVGRTVSKYNLGITLNPHDPLSILNALMNANSSKKVANTSIYGVDDFIRSNTPEKHAELVYCSFLSCMKL